MNEEQFLSIAKRHLHALCADISDRSVGSVGNRHATNYFKNELTKNNWNAGETLLHVMDWKTDGALLKCRGTNYEVFSSPYSLGCSTQGDLTAVSSFKELQNKGLSSKILLLHGEIAREQIMPKNFVFYNPEEHQRLISILENSGVKAIVCATGYNPALAGGVYPFPMFEDGDFNIPSVFMKDVEGQKLIDKEGEEVFLESKAERIPEAAYNVIARKRGSAKKRIVITAHIDAKKGTPGAIDNATGVTILLLLSELLKEYNGKYPVELVAFNGEDYYAVPGQMKYIEQNKEGFSDILLNINIDGAGYKVGGSSFSLFDLPGKIRNIVQNRINSDSALKEGIPWYQGDHSIFLQYGCPAIAVSSSWFIENMDTQNITHTPEDNLEIVNYRRVCEIAFAIHDIIDKLDK